MMSYATMLVLLLGPAVPAALFLVVHDAPLALSQAPWRTFRQFWAKPEVAIPLGFGLDAIRRLGLILSGFPVRYPGFGWATATYLTLGFMCVALWARIFLLARERATIKGASE